MHFLKNFKKTLKYDFLNKFVYKNTKKLPIIKKIILNFGCKNNDLKYLASSLLALELLTTQKGSLTLIKHSNILLKIRKGNPIGCKVTLRKKQILKFLTKIITKMFSKIKNFKGIKLSKKIKHNTFTYEVRDNFNFQELENHYYLFNFLNYLNITLNTNTKTKEELIFLLNSFKFPLK